VRPHQALNMATPAERFRPVPVEQRAVLGLWRPPELAPTGPSCELPADSDSIDDEPDEPVVAAAQGGPATRRWPSRRWKSTGSCRPAATSGCVASSSGWARSEPDAR
jgi:hypothetical protein